MKLFARGGFVYWRSRNGKEGLFCNIPERRKLWRCLGALISAALVLELANECIAPIAQTLTQLCELQMQQQIMLPRKLAAHHFCFELRVNLHTFWLVVFIAMAAVPCALAGWWYRVDQIKKSPTKAD